MAATACERRSRHRPSVRGRLQAPRCAAGTRARSGVPRLRAFSPSASMVTGLPRPSQAESKPMSSDGLQAAAQKMREAGHSDEAIRAFESAYERLEGGESGMMPTAELEPATDVPSLEELPEGDPAGALEQFAVIKLNGGLATTMGLRSPKSLIEAREGRSFLDIIVGQTLALRRRFGVRLPLVLMNSQATREETLRALEAYPDLEVGLPLDFLQSMI